MKKAGSMLGKKIARGVDFVVYEYGNDRVIKFSTLVKLLKEKHIKKLKTDYTICKKYLPKYVLETFFVDNKKNRHIEIQQKILGQQLTKDQCKNNKIKDQLLEIKKGIKKMQEDGHHPIDLLGYGGIFKKKFSNILIDQKGNLKIIDASILESGSVGFLGFLFSPVMFLARIRQKHLLGLFLKSI